MNTQDASELDGKSSGSDMNTQDASELDGSFKLVN